VIGHGDSHLTLLNRLYGVSIYSKGESIFVDTDDQDIIAELERLFTIIQKIAAQHIQITDRDIIYISKLVSNHQEDEILDIYINRHLITKTKSGKPIYAKTLNQKNYLKAIEQNDLVFGIGPAGTGKTYVAVIEAVSKLRNNDVKKIILTRPAVEAGEKLGFLPGDLKEKIDPYLRPLYDALYEVLGTEYTEDLIEKGIIEIAPLAYMRGRTLENAYVILDEAQNTTTNQMKLFLTRLGFRSKMIVTGDITQIDLPRKDQSGLIQATKLLKDIEGIAIVAFDRIDVIRHPLVQKVLKEYEKYENKYYKFL
jgi:phosphate starvation-inducible PhoH-like protein